MASSCCVRNLDGKSVTLGRVLASGTGTGSFHCDGVNKWTDSRKLLNVYGPTESSMVVTTKEVHAKDNPHNIGKPFSTVGAFIMNQDCSDLVPYGGIGELCVAGPQLSAGYVNNTEATNASFTGCERLGTEKMYRTGDLARWCLGMFYPKL